MLTKYMTSGRNSTKLNKTIMHIKLTNNTANNKSTVNTEIT